MYNFLSCIKYNDLENNNFGGLKIIFRPFLPCLHINRISIQRI